MADLDKPPSLGCRNAGIRILILLLGVPIVLGIIAFLVMWLPIPGLSSHPGSMERNLVAAITVGFAGLAILVLIVLYIRNLLRNASHCMDAYFLDKGMSLSKALGYGRSFLGTINDIKLEGMLLPSYYFQPWRLYVTLHKSIGIVGSIGNRSPIVNRYCKPYHLKNSLSSYYIVSTNPEAMRSYLTNSVVEKTILKMIQGFSRIDTWELRFFENRVEFRTIQYEFQPKLKEQSLDAFFSLFK